ncbi:MAG: DNRLRE domain-containing protein [Planctomycetota bacterium]|jgi:hypothetical protein
MKDLFHPMAHCINAGVRPLCVSGLLLVAAGARADVVTLTPVKDNTLFSTDGTTSNGAGNAVFSGRTGPSSGSVRQRAVVAFDVSGSVPPGSTITSAGLTLTLISAGAAGDQTHTLHRIAQDWGEGTSIGFGGTGAPSTPGDATWLHTFFPDLLWANQGGDFEPTASGSTIVGTTPGPYTWSSTPQMVADVQGWLDDPASDFGWLVKGNEDLDNTAKKLASREAKNEGQRPLLAIEFTPPPCPWDCQATPDGNVGISDLLALLAQWGGPGTCDFNGAGVGINDLLDLLANWGGCR